jgi:hypothetical protein
LLPVVGESIEDVTGFLAIGHWDAFFNQVNDHLIRQYFPLFDIFQDDTDPPIFMFATKLFNNIFQSEWNQPQLFGDKFCERSLTCFCETNDRDAGDDANVVGNRLVCLEELWVIDDFLALFVIV